MANKALRVQIKPWMLRWARERAGLSIKNLVREFPKIEAWEKGEILPTLKQLERFAKVVRVPLGFLFLEFPPQESLPIPDLRTIEGPPRRPSPDLLDTIYLCQQRQEWYRDYLQSLKAKPLAFIGSFNLEDDPNQVAKEIQQWLNFSPKERQETPTWTEALRLFAEKAESIGILVMASSIVGSNTRRKLNPEEFRGFSLVDDLAPLIFINAADTKAAQMFTLAHELAHVWCGQSGVSNPEIALFPSESVERWCNQVAAELLVPAEELLEEYRDKEPLKDELSRLARHFKVSTLVILRRLYELGVSDRETFWQTYKEEISFLRTIERRGSGGDYYRTLYTRVGKTFAQAVVISVLEGRTLYRDAFQMLGIRSPKTFQKLAQNLGVV